MSAITLLFALLALSGILIGSGERDVFCGDLDRADCRILEQSARALARLESHRVQFSLQVGAADSATAPPVEMSVQGLGTVTGKPSEPLALPAHLLPMIADPASLARLAGALEPLDAELSLVIALPPALVAESTEDMPVAFPVNIRLVDGVGYVDFATLREALGSSAGAMPDGWRGVALDDVASALAEPLGVPANADAQASLFEPAFLDAYRHVERLDDAMTVDGTPVAQFRTTLDFTGVGDDPAFRDMLRAWSRARTSEAVTEAELETAVTTLGAWFESMVITVTEQIDLDTGYPRSRQIAVDWDTARLMQPAPAGERPEAAPRLLIEMNATYSDFNAVEPPTAPEGATVVSPEAFASGGLPGAASATAEATAAVGE